MKKAILSSILAFILILSIIILERIFLYYPLEIINLLYSSVVYSIPIIITFIFGYRYNAKNPNSKKIFIYMPLYSIVPAAITTILQVVGFFIFGRIGSPESGMIFGFLHIYIITFVIIYVIISLFLATIVNSNSKIYKIILTFSIIIIFIITLILSANYLIKCGGFDGCTQDNLVCFAYNTNNIEKCERARGGTSGTNDLVLSFSKIHRGYKSGCFLKLAILKKDSSICERAGDLRNECYIYFTHTEIDFRYYPSAFPLPNCS